MQVDSHKQLADEFTQKEETWKSLTNKMNTMQKEVKMSPTPPEEIHKKAELSEKINFLEKKLVRICLEFEQA